MDFCGLKKVYQRIGSMDDDTLNTIFDESDLAKLPEEERKVIKLEGMQLQEGRLYLVAIPNGDSKVQVRCYDTTGSELSTAAHMLMRGLLSVIESSFDEIMHLGHENILYSLLDDINNPDGERNLSYESKDNIIKIDFPKRDKPQ